MNDIAHDENTPYLHEDPTVDAELRGLEAVELPRRPPLLSTPNVPGHRQVSLLIKCSRLSTADLLSAPADGGIGNRNSHV